MSGKAASVKAANHKPVVGVGHWPAHLSNGDIARGTGISRVMISRIRNGLRTPSLEAAEKIANYLGLPLGEFTAGLRERQGMKRAVSE